MFWKLLLFVVISSLLHVVVKNAARILPKDPEIDLSEVPSEMIAKAAKRADRLGTGAAFLSFLFLTPAWFLGFWALQTWLRPTLAAGEFAAVPMNLLRMLSASAAGYILASLVAFGVMRLVIGRSFYLSLAAGNKFYGFKAGSFFYLAMVWCLPACFEYELHAVGTYTVFAKSGITESESLLWPAASYAWPALEKIDLARPFTAKRQEIGRAPELRLTFRDGHRWTDVPWWLPIDEQGTTKSWTDVATYCQQQSGLAPRIQQGEVR